jgi:chloramphenicol-sensitive protein RarD
MKENLTPASNAHYLGILFGIAAFVFWGLFPMYWKLIHDVNALEVLAHRAVWSAALLVAMVIVSSQQHKIVAAFSSPRLLAGLTLNAAVISVNWWLYVFAVQQGHVLDTSLGYFINPIFSVFLGTIVLKERLRKSQWFAVGLACSGIINSVVNVGHFPWISLGLAGTFATYGLVKKLLKLDAIISLTCETIIVLPIAVGYLFYLSAQNELALFHRDGFTDMLLIGAGVITIIPLLLFGAAAKRLPLSTLGFFQYLTPTMLFLFAVVLYQEPFSNANLTTFVLIWSAIAVFLLGARRTTKSVTT